ncbi:nitroreductase family protein [Candidatus Nanohalovita haloferacivicina]|uniref:nitroreductase family protein n=1 Tax=Candidatus Nanohalovita haloferacivicina TaxID=2978046 RepID=UPI00325F9B1A|nr:Nitroreductase [Candidatus Nanohalobia archaeon BNXNv]
MTSQELNELRSEAEENRGPGHEIEPLLYQRWSPRSIGTDMTEEDLEALFEAARWAPSSYNNQSWRFIYATHEDSEFEDFVDLMGDFNTEWAGKAFALVVIASKTTFDHNGEESITHSFDTGAAWQNLALEATRRGLVAHGMQGFDYSKAREKLSIPEEFDVEAMIAIGSKEDEEDVDEDAQVEPNGRKSLDEIRSKGSFDF